MTSSVDKKFKRGFGCIARELIARIVPGSPTTPDCLPQTVADLCRESSPRHAARAAHRMLPAGRCVSAVAKYRAIQRNDDALPPGKLLIASSSS